MLTLKEIQRLNELVRRQITHPMETRMRQDGDQLELPFPKDKQTTTVESYLPIWWKIRKQKDRRGEEH